MRTLAKDRVNNALVSQIVRSATSIGANYMEADGAESKKDFRHKLPSVKKNQKKQNTGCGCLLKQIQIKKMIAEIFGMKRKS